MNSLLQAIYDDPHDTALRLVYADALLQAGDMRGELIVLQCSRRDGQITEREHELLRLHGRTWLGAIDPIVRQTGLAYRRGFVAKARESATELAHDPLLGAPEWATLEELELTAISGERACAFLADPRWKALRAVWNVRGDDLVALARRCDMLPWTTIAVRAVRDWVHLAPLTAFPALTELVIIDGRDVVEALLTVARAPFGRSLRRVRVPFPATRHAVVQVIAAARAAELAELELHHEWTFTGDGEGELLRLEGEHATLVFQSAHPELHALTRLAELLPYGVVRTIAVEGEANITLGAWKPFAEALRAKGADVPDRP